MYKNHLKFKKILLLCFVFILLIFVNLYSSNNKKTNLNTKDNTAKYNIYIKRNEIYKNSLFYPNISDSLFIKSFILKANIQNNSNLTKKNQSKTIYYDETEKIKMFADSVTRDDLNKKIIAEGNVKVLYKDSTCYSDKLEYNDGSSFAKASGNVRIRDPQNYIKGQSFEYAVNIETGTILNAKTFSDVWIITSQKMKKVSKEKVISYKAKITTCDYEKPHYYFKASKVVVYLEKKFIAYNVVLYIKGVPIFYMPIWKQNLKKSKLQFTVRAGQNQTDGIYGKVKAKYSFDSDNSLSLQTDGYENRGLGLGMQYDYKNKDITNGSIYLYGINDKVDMSTKRTAKIRHSQKIKQNWKSYTNINYQNDESFYKTYYYSGSSSQLEPTDSQVNSNIYSYSSLNYTKDLYYMNILWESEKNWDNTKKSYVKSREILPSFDFTTNKNKFFINNLFYKYNFNFANNYDTATDTYYRTGSTYFNLTRTKKINKNITLTPTVGIKETMTSEKDERNEFKEKFSTKMDSSVNLRNRLNRDMDLDITYNYTTGILDTKTVDTNKINLSLSSYLLMGDLRITNSTGYDIQKIDTENNELKRMDDFSTEIKYKISKYFNFYGKHNYSFDSSRTSLVQSIFYFYPSAKLTFMENASFLRSNNGTIDTISTIKYRPNLKWKIDYSYRVEYDYLRDNFNPYTSQEFALYRDLHCWEVKFSMLSKRESDGDKVREFWITFKLKAIPNQSISLYRNNQDYVKWYEWDFKNKS